MKKAFITGITGQDGGYLAELLLDKDYEVHAIKRRSASDNTDRINHLLGHPNLHMHFGDLSDASSLLEIFNKNTFDEVYNLAAQSFVKASFDIPTYTGDIDGLGVTRILEIMKSQDLFKTTRFYQASTSELYGKVVETPQSETTPFYPRSPYGVAKLYAFWIIKNYREAYGLHGSNGILFNHESPWRGIEFVTQKVITGVANIKKGKQEYLSMGNIDARRDWGHAKDYVRGMWQILQQPEPDDYVLATGQLYSVRDLIELTFAFADEKIRWSGEGVNEIGVDSKGIVRVKINPEYFRPTEVDILLGDPSKAEKVLGWKREYTFESLVLDMYKSAMEKP